MITLTTLLLGGCLTVRLPGTHIQRNSQPEVITWPRLVEKTLQFNPDLQSARYVITSAARSRDIAFGDYLPSFDGEVQRTASRSAFSGSSGGNSGSSGSGGGGGLQDNLSLDLVGSQSLFNGFGTTGSFLKTRRDLDVAKFQYAVTDANVRNALKLAYIDVLRWNHLLKTDQAIADLAVDVALVMALDDFTRRLAGTKTGQAAVVDEVTDDFLVIRAHLGGIGFDNHLDAARTVGMGFHFHF